MIRQQALRRGQSGISLPEVLAAIIVIGATVMPVSNALRGAMAVAESDAAALARHYHLTSKLEEVLAEPFAGLEGKALGPMVASDYSDAPGSKERRIVYVSGYDGDDEDGDKDPFTGVDDGLLLVRVEIDGRPEQLQALRSEW